MKTPLQSVLRKAVLLASLFLASATHQANAVVLDFGVDSENLGKGDWIYFVSSATNKLGGNVPSVINIPTLMSYYQSKGFKFIVVKAGEGSTNFPTGGTQFTQTLVNEAHAKGLKIFGYTRSYGVNIPGEIAVVTNALNKGADGYVIDAEVEWEAQNMSGGPAKAIQLCTGIKNVFPNRFLAHSPLPIISLHSTFPYKEFGLHCDAVMPQDYWYSFGKTPTQTVDWMDTEWRNWQNSLTGSDRDAIKPLAPVGQADSTGVLAGEVNEFIDYLRSDPKAVTAGGYRGCSFWRADLHKGYHWTELENNSIGGSAPGDGSIIVDNVNATATGTWSTGSSATDKYAVDYRYKGQGTGTCYIQFTPGIPVAGDYQLYEWHSQGANRSAGAPHNITYNGGTANLLINQKVNGGRWNWMGTFNFLAGSAGNVRIMDSFSDAGQIAMADGIKLLPVVADVVMDNSAAYFTGSWSTGTGATDKYGANYRYKAPGGGSSYAEYIPNLPVAGYYDVFEWHCQGSNRAVNAPYTVYGTIDGSTVWVNQTVDGGQWNYLGMFQMPLGTAGSIRINDNFSGSVVIADAIKLVFVSQ